MRNSEVHLQPHQQRVIDRLYSEGTPGLIAYHSMGSGKTLTALEALRRANGNKLVITPASLVENVYKESKKHGIPLDQNTEVLSYEKALRNIDRLLDKDYGLVVLDEAHRMRNDDTVRAQELTKVLNRAHKKLLLTGTAGYNHPADLMRLINLIDNKLEIPSSNRDFEDRYLYPKSLKLREDKELASILHKYVDVYDAPRTSSDFPRVTEEVINVPMSRKQESVYRFAEGSIPATLRRSMRKNLPMSLKDTTALNVFSSGVRQASTSPTRLDATSVPEDSSKLLAAADRMVEAAKEPGFRGVAYSNYLGSGVEPYAEILRKRGLDPLLYTGSLSSSDKKKLLDAYNEISDKAKILLLSSSGAEGIDLRGTRLLQVLEPHFNQAKIDQVKARGARYKSHEHLPSNDRSMRIEQYLATKAPNKIQQMLHLKPATSIDEYLYTASRQKQHIIDDLKSLASNGSTK